MKELLVEADELWSDSTKNLNEKEVSLGSGYYEATIQYCGIFLTK